MDTPEVAGLLLGDLEVREEHLHELLKRAAVNDRYAVAALRVLAANYHGFDAALYSRAMNRASSFVDGNLEAPLLAALGDQQYGCQAWAAMGCRALRLRSAVAQLRALLLAGDWLERQEAAAALGAAGDDSAVPDLAKALHHPEVSTREAAASALAELRTDAASHALWREFDRGASERIGHIASALARFGPAAAPRLRVVAEDEDPNRRYWAAVALGAVAEDADTDRLERMTEDGAVTAFGRQVRVAAKQALRTSHRIRSAISKRDS